MMVRDGDGDGNDNGQMSVRALVYKENVYLLNAGALVGACCLPLMHD